MGLDADDKQLDEELESSQKEMPRVLKEVISSKRTESEKCAEKLIGNYAVPFSENQQDAEHLYFLSLLQTDRMTNQPSGKLTYDLTNQKDKSEFDLRWRARACEESTEKMLEGEEIFIKHKTSRMLVDEYKRLKGNSETTAHSDLVINLFSEQKKQVSQVPIVPKPASRSVYAQLEGGDKSDLPVSAPTTLNNELVVGNLSASNDATVPLMIGTGPVISTITTPYRKRMCGHCGDRMDLLNTLNKRNVLRGREHPEGFKWKNSTCTFPCRRCGQSHEGQGFFCNAPISTDQDMLFRTSIAYCQNTTEANMDLMESWREIEHRTIKRRIKKETNAPAAKKNKPTPPKASNPPPPSSILQFPPPNNKKRKKSQNSPAAGSDTKLDFFQKQAKGKQQCLIHAVNNVLGADVFMLAHFKAASKKAGKERTGDFSMEDFRALAGIDDAETNQLLVGQSALGQKDFHALTFLPSERGFEELIMAKKNLCKLPLLGPI